MKDSQFNRLRNRWLSFIGEFSTSERFTQDFNARYPFVKYFESANVAFGIVNHATLEIEHHSNNLFSVLGLDKNEFKQRGTQTFIDNIDKEHINFFTKLPKYFNDYWEDTPFEQRQDIVRRTIGLKYNHGLKGKTRLALQTFIIEANSAKMPNYLFVLYQDITYMMKDDFFWIRYSNLDKNIKPLVYHDAQQELLKDDILSIREKEILRLIIDGKTTEEIANELFISRITVNNHRQNMLNRLGVKDTTGLITLADMCKLLV